MRAGKLFHYKAHQGRLLMEMVIWSLPAATAKRPHGLKYRLYCGRNGECIVCYDNESAKGDHRHYGSHEEAYDFVSLEKLIDDFRKDCTDLAGWKWET